MLDSKGNWKDYKHLLYLIFWPVFGLLFFLFERVYVVSYYHPIHCIIDDYIPFNEFFFIPYLGWFVMLVWGNLYLMLKGKDAFVKMMKFTIFTYGVALLTFLLYPSCQQLRPETFARDNILTRFLAQFYGMDTPTNVFPSIHVLGAIAVMLGALEVEKFKKLPWKVFFIGSGVLVSISTVFLKQHSILDVLAATVLCIIGWLLFFRKRKVNKG